MPMNARTHDNNKESSKQQCIKLGIQERVLLRQTIAQGAIIQPGNFKPESFRPRDVLQLQSVIGNKAMGRFLAGTVQCKPAYSAPKSDRKLAVEKPDEHSAVTSARQEYPRNKTNLPNELKAGVESLSGISMAEIKVHYNSTKPAQLQAFAFTEGRDIYLGQGQEKYLPHECWHVAQQMQGRVNPTRQLKGVFINNDQRLEKEADEMGDMALRVQRAGANLPSESPAGAGSQWVAQLNGDPTITHETKFAAPDGSAKTRLDVGVGEEVTFTGSAAGNWSATGGAPATLANRDTFNWTAPNRAATATIKLEVGDKNKTVTMNVLEPNDITATKIAEIDYGDGVPGAGMYLLFNYLPKTVSFGNLKAKEISGPATNITGYFRRYYTDSELDHNAGADFNEIGENNIMKDAYDTASESGFPNYEFEKGTYNWVIPNNFIVKSESGNGKEFTKVTHAVSVYSSGKVKITKAGATVERSPI